MQTTLNPTRKQLRAFGLMMTFVLCIIGFWPLIVHADPARGWFVFFAALFAIFSLIFSRVLIPVFRVWMTLGRFLGWLNTRIILAVCFYGLVTPIGLFMRIIGKDPLCHGFDPRILSYRVLRTSREATHMKRQY